MGAILTTYVEARLAASRTSLSAPGVDFTTSAKDFVRFRQALLRWYDLKRRDLPWRNTREPYRIWISEIMLQQTRVAAVLDHYRIFLERFPNIQALAAASEDAVLAAWSGLGYYRRARLLHQCAKELVQHHAGRFPQTAEGLLNLPGIGRYTAAAVASIAFSQPVAVVDGNVERVLERLAGINLTATSAWQYAQALLASSRPGDSNQAMMELGATLCVPGEPRCRVCPVRKWCATQGKEPRTKQPSRQEKRQMWCSLDQRGFGISRNINGKGKGRGHGKIRLVQRPKRASLMGGMWELPQSSDPPLRLKDAVRWRTFRHSVTVTDYTVHVLRNTPLPGIPLAKGKWIAIDRIPQTPITGLTRKILKAGGII